MKKVINIDELLDEYIQLKSQEKAVKEAIKSVQADFNAYFTGNELDIYCNAKYELKKQPRNTISYNESIKELLKSKGIYEAVVVVDKNKLGGMLEAKVLTPSEVAPYEEVKTSFAWVVEEVKRDEGGD